jgi:hypothetical protein
MFLVGLLVPLPIGAWLIRKRRADVPLSLIGLASVPVIVWGASLGAKIGPCGVPDCMSHTQHSHLVWSIISLGLLLAGFAVLGIVHRMMVAGSLIVVGLLVGAYSMLKTDIAAAIMILIIAGFAVIYVGGNYLVEREDKRVPDFPPVG